MNSCLFRLAHSRPALTLPLSFLIGLTCSCAVGPEYVRPDSNSPQSFESQIVLRDMQEVSSDRETLDTEQKLGQHPSVKTDYARAPIDWWQGFNDPILTDLVETALRNNFSIAQSYAFVREAEARLDLADSSNALLSVFDIEGTANRDKELSGDRSLRKSESLFGIFSFILPLDIFGRSQREEEAAIAELEAARAQLRSSVLRISAEVTGEYLQIRGNQQQLSLLRESVQLQEETQRIVKSRFESGLSPELDLRRAEAAVENLRADIPPLEEALTRSRHRLSTLTGEFQVVTEASLGAADSIPRYTAQVPNMLPVQVLTLRPDVQQAEAELKRSVANIGLAEAQWYPLVNLVGQVGIGRDGQPGMPTIELFISSIAATIQQTLTDGGARRAQVEIAEAQSFAALANYRQTLLFAVEEVEGLLASIQASADRQVSLQKAVVASERSFFQAEILYRQGLTSFLDVVDAQRVLASVQQELAAAQTNYSSQVANLFRVLGTQRANL